MAERTTTSKPAVKAIDTEQAVLKHMSKQELVQCVEDLQEELRMSRAFSAIAETGAKIGRAHV